MVISQAEYDIIKKKKIKIDEPFSQGCEEGQSGEPYGFVPSSSTPGVYYMLSGPEDNLSCSCPARVACKHLKDGKDTCLRISGPVQKEV